MVMLALFMSSLASAAEPSWSVKAVQEQPPAAVADKIREELDRAGWRVTDPNSTTVLTLWLRTRIPAQATAEQLKNGLSAREIPEGTLLGVVQFSALFKDSRKQDIAPGVYTLRFALQPDIGDHAGTVPHPEFVLLIPAADDAAPGPREVKDVLKLSKAATNGDHPAVMLLFPVNASESATKITRKEDRFQVLQIRRQLTTDAGESAPWVFALTIDGHSKTR